MYTVLGQACLPSYQLSPSLCFRFFDLGTTALSSPHTPWTPHMHGGRSAGSLPGQVPLGQGKRIPPRERRELATSRVHVFPALAETSTGIQQEACRTITVAVGLTAVKHSEGVSVFHRQLHF